MDITPDKSYYASEGQLGFLPPAREKSNGQITNLPNWTTLFPANTYRDVPGLCKVATLVEIETQGWSLNPGRYMGVADRATDEGDFAERLEELNEELELLNAEARELEERMQGRMAICPYA